MKCPFCCSQGGVRPICYPSECAMSDGNGDCLIRQALQCYVKSTKEKAEFTRSYIGPLRICPTAAILTNNLIKQRGIIYATEF